MLDLTPYRFDMMLPMRAFLSFFLAIMVSLNTVYAASVGMCDALEQTRNHASHIWHHSHDHGNAQSPDADGSGKTHLHDHAHPSFSFLLPNIIPAMPPKARGSKVASPACAFNSAPQTPPDIPPRSALA